MNFLFVHGWGFNPSFWEPLIARSQAMRGAQVTCIDLGFIISDQARQSAYDASSDTVVIGHSLGVMWALEQGCSDICAFISINGFDCFYRDVNPASISLMRRGLKRNPYAQMCDFWKRCGAGSTPFFNAESLNAQALADGLEQLAQGDYSAQRKALTAPVLALASTQDAIVPQEMSTSIWQNADLRLCETGSHVLPLTHTQWCAQHIDGFLENV